MSEDLNRADDNVSSSSPVVPYNFSNEESPITVVQKKP